MAILAGGAVAVIAQRLAFGHSQRLQEIEARRHERALMRGLMTEMRENKKRLEPTLSGSFPTAPSVRGAWDAARELTLNDEIFDAIAVAYASAASVDGSLALVVGRVIGKGIVLDAKREEETNERAFEVIRRDGKIAHAMFVRALALLEAAKPLD